MRILTLVAAVALAVSAAPSIADACGGYGQSFTPPVEHTVTGPMAFLSVDKAGRVTAFVSYPTIDGQRTDLYGESFRIRDDRTTRALLRRVERLKQQGRSAGLRLTLARTGEVGAWRIVSSPLRA